MNTQQSAQPARTSLHWSKALYVGLSIAMALGLALSTALAAQTMTVTYVTPNRQGNIAYTAQQAFRGGSEGKFVVDGKSYPGSVYAAVGGGFGMVWYYGTSGNAAGSALFKAQPDGTQGGPILFFDRAGNVIDSGTATLN